MPDQDKNLFQNNERFELVLKGINAGVYECYFSTSTCWWSSKFYELLGYKRGEIESSEETLLGKLADPEHRFKLKKAITDCWNSKEPFVEELRLLHHSGNYRWYKITGQSKWENDKPAYLIGTLLDIDARVHSQIKNLKNEFLLEEVGKMAKTGGWEIDLINQTATWSKEMSLIHDLPENSQPSLEDALKYLKPEYLADVKQTINDAISLGIPYDKELKIITAKKREIWIRAMGKPVYDNKKEKIIGLRGVFQDIDDRKTFQLENQKNQLILEEVGHMAKVGGWEVNPQTMQGTWSKEVTLIHEMPLGYQPTLEEALKFVHPDFIETIQKVVGDCLSMGSPFDTELKIITGTKREVWVRAMGKAIYDDQQQHILGVRGIFQDIDEQKEKELELKSSVNLINEQNGRLVNFAHIVSHNLRSHAANLQLTLDLLEAETDPKEIEHFEGNLRKISNSLNQTISHLNDVAMVQTDSHSIKKPIRFESSFRDIIATLKPEIEQNKIQITSDFNEVPEIEYIPAYLDSIFLNLLTNAIKYRHPEKKTIISVRTYKEEKKTVLEVSDNGLGIDLEKFGTKLFGMYKTFHNNPNAKGIGLFITKSQIETLGGKILVNSEVNKGSTFKIIF